MLNMRMTLDDRQLRRMVSVAPKQLRYATAVTLTRLAQQSQEKVQKLAESHFDTTKNWWAKNRPTGIQIKPAKKTDLQAQVKTGRDNDWLERQETGKRRRPKRTGKLVVPVYDKSGKSLQKNDRKWRGLKVPTWRKARGESVAKTKYANKKYPVVFQDSKGKTFIKRSKRAAIETLYIRKSSSKGVRRRFKMIPTTLLVVKRNARQTFITEFNRAVSRE